MSMLATYACATCTPDDLGESPFVAASEAEAAWMHQNAFASLAMRAWTDSATLAEVEQRAQREGGDVWALELSRKRCAVGEPKLCASEEIGRVLALAQQGRVYAQYVLAESYVRLADASESVIPSAVAMSARASAAEAMFAAAVRGDGKAERKLVMLGTRMSRPWTADELRRAAFGALSSQNVEAATAASQGRTPLVSPPRPTRALTETVQMLREWEARTRAAHAVPADAGAQ